MKSLSDCIRAWLEHDYATRQYSPNSYDRYVNAINQLCEYFRDAGDATENFTEESFVAIRDWFLSMGYGKNSYFICETILKRFTKWAQSKGYVEKFDIPSRPAVKDFKETLGSKPLAPEYYFKIRKMRKVTLAPNVAMFEMLMSTGMRAGEIGQITKNDIDLDYRIDPYVKGRIALDPTRMAIKNRKARHVYLSVSAAKYLKLYLASFKIPRNVPIFPFHRREAARRVRQMTENTVKLLAPDVETVSGQWVDESDDIDLTTMDPEFREQFIKNKEKEEQFLAKQRKYLQDLSRNEKLKNSFKDHDHLQIHGMRKSFAAMMFYRDWWGRKGSWESVQLLLGHAMHADVTYKHYVQSNSLVSSEKAWDEWVFGSRRAWPETLKQFKMPTYNTGPRTKIRKL